MFNNRRHVMLISRDVTRETELQAFSTIDARRATCTKAYTLFCCSHHADGTV